jgi:membrane protease YdiL (CAAX protease family)
MAMVLTVTQDQVEQMFIPKSILFHLFPGLFVVLFDIAVAPIVEQLGFPLIFTLILANLLILIPVELTILLYMSKKENDNFNLKELIPYFEPLPLKKFLGLFCLIFIWAFLINMLMFPVTTFLSENVFAWMPEVFFSNEQATIMATDFSLYSQTNLMIVLILAILGIGIGVPIVEELYFRGFLMSRISRFSIWTPVISVGLWAFYHFWAPWSFLTYLLAFIPIAFVVLKAKNLYLSITGHILANLMLVMSLAPLMLG